MSGINSVFPGERAALLLILSIVSWMSISYAEAPDMGSYDSYTKAVDTICYASGNDAPPWNKPIGGKAEVPEPLLSIVRNNYPDIYSPSANTEFRKGIESIKGDPGELQ